MNAVDGTGRHFLRYGKTKNGARLALIVAMIAALLAGLSGCSLIGDALQQKTTPQENLDYQRTTALKFKSRWPNVEEITFTREGAIDGSGEWTTNAIVTIDGKEYQEILGPWATGGQPLPTPPTSFVSTPVTVNYSDGTSEVLE
ncbi:hypothetical protein AB4Z18_03245 [Leifsonia sp. 2TAF2]|uniref:hypothetical protein n=1 Tax=Leifsonia sp. 2TAF2 TaxID=3233009 RepID=UPI003F9A3FCA